jgi:adenine phosphoribosyltransferase
MVKHLSQTTSNPKGTITMTTHTCKPHLDLNAHIRDIPDWPKPGILFKDITPLLQNPASLSLAVELMASPFRGQNVQLVCGAESRGFIFGTAVAQSLSAGFIPIRKPKKLPAATHTITYDLEYGTDSLQIHTDAVKPGQRVLMVDDLLATGGTMKACCDLIEQLGGEIVGISVLIELAFLHGRDKLTPYENVHAVLSY